MAAEVFRSVTGFDRVMVYRFLEDQAGVVVAESDNRPGMRTAVTFPISHVG